MGSNSKTEPTTGDRAYRAYYGVYLVVCLRLVQPNFDHVGICMGKIVKLRESPKARTTKASSERTRWQQGKLADSDLSLLESVRLQCARLSKGKWVIRSQAPCSGDERADAN